MSEVEEKFEISSVVQKMLDRIVLKMGAFGFQTFSGVCSGGMDPEDFGKEAFNDYLQSFPDEALYKSCSLPTQLKM